MLFALRPLKLFINHSEWDVGAETFAAQLQSKKCLGPEAKVEIGRFSENINIFRPMMMVMITEP